MKKEQDFLVWRKGFPQTMQPIMAINESAAVGKYKRLGVDNHIGGKQIYLVESSTNLFEILVTEYAILVSEVEQNNSEISQ